MKQEGEMAQGGGRRLKKRVAYLLDPKVHSCLVLSPLIDYISEDKDYILLILVTVDEKGAQSKPDKLKV